MDLISNGSLRFDLSNSSLDDPDVLIREGNTYRRLDDSDVQRLDQPIYLKTPNLVLYLQYDRYSGDDKRVTFDTGPIVTPKIILGAIHTYYQEPLKQADLDEISEENGGPYLAIARNDLQHGNRVIRKDLMGDLSVIEGIVERPDGTYYVALGS